jgi:hypothetical protein
MDATINPWWESELAGCVFVDQRLAGVSEISCEGRAVILFRPWLV